MLSRADAFANKIWRNSSCRRAESSRSSVSSFREFVIDQGAIGHTVGHRLQLFPCLSHALRHTLDVFDVAGLTSYHFELLMDQKKNPPRARTGFCPDVFRRKLFGMRPPFIAERIHCGLKVGHLSERGFVPSHFLRMALFHLLYALSLRLALSGEQLSHHTQLARHVFVTFPGCFVADLVFRIDFSFAKGSLPPLFRPCTLQIVLELLQFIVGCASDHVLEVFPRKMSRFFISESAAIP